MVEKTFKINKKTHFRVSHYQPTSKLGSITTRASAINHTYYGVPIMYLHVKKIGKKVVTTINAVVGVVIKRYFIYIVHAGGGGPDFALSVGPVGS